MLSCLRIRDFAVIDEAELSFSKGLNVVTGETGAGKSILIDALTLVLGGRARPDVVRSGAKSAEVEALFDLRGIADRPAALATLDAEADELVVRRVITQDRSRAFANGRLVSAGELAAMMGGLVEICSQHEHHSLLDARTHLQVVDGFADNGELLSRMREARDEWAAHAKRVDELATSEATREQRIDFLRYQLREIEALDPRLGEDEELRAERERLKHAVHLSRTATESEDALYDGDDAICTRLARVVAAVRDAARLDAALAPIAEQLTRAEGEIDDAARALGRYARSIESDDARLLAIEERIDAYARLSRKHGGSFETLAAFRTQATDELARLERHDAALAEATQARDAAQERARLIAGALSERRQAAAGKLATAIGKELGSLAMKGATVEVQITKSAADGDAAASSLSIDGARVTAAGYDNVELLIAPNPGEGARPLRRVASGGELSRALLAIKRVLARDGRAGAYVFDEIDSGVGGSVADVIGKKLGEVAKKRQVVCVTHLAQIAAYGTSHFVVEKSVAKGRTTSTIRSLDDRQRVDELARMIGGASLTARTRAAAAELLGATRMIRRAA